LTERARPYLHHIVVEVERRAMPSEIVLLPIIESAYCPEAYSPSHAEASGS
jgi:membrane-bound lytic murein transglycosylase D